MNYLLDTNIALIYIQASPMAKRLERDLHLLEDGNMLFISVVSVGEIESLMLQRKYGEKKRTAFKKLLERLTILDIHLEEVIGRYAELDAYSQGRHPSRPSAFTARNMGKNDLWIAATASLFDITLVTTDRDFDHLSEAFLHLTYVDIGKYRDNGSDRRA